MENITIREARKEDCAEISRLIKELAAYLECSEEAELCETDLEEDGFAAKCPYFQCIVAELCRDEDPPMLVGYAIYFFIYSTWIGKSVYLEDIYVKPEYRKLGLGSLLFSKVAEKGHKSGCKKMDFVVLDQSPAGNFYKNKGAIDITEKEGWHHYRLNEEEMKNQCHVLKNTENQ